MIKLSGVVCLLTVIVFYDHSFWDNDLFYFDCEDVVFKFGKLPQQNNFSKYLSGGVRRLLNILDAFNCIFVASLSIFSFDNSTEATCSEYFLDFVFLCDWGPDLAKVLFFHEIK